MIIATSAKYTF